MGFQVLGQSSAFSEGATLWVVPNLEASNWTKRINWYSNMLISNASVHKRKDLSESLKKMMEEFEVSPQTILEVNSKLPTLIATDDIFPTKKNVIVPYSGDLKEWIIRIYEVWKSLEKPLVRIFLPINVNESEFRESWPKYIDIEWATIVPDRALL